MSDNGNKSNLGGLLISVTEYQPPVTKSAAHQKLGSENDSGDGQDGEDDAGDNNDSSF